MLSLLLASVLFSAPNPPTVTVAGPAFRTSGLETSRGELLADHLATELTRHGLKVTTSSQIGALLSQERQRQLLGGCTEDSASCVAELAGALGSDAVVNGAVAKLDSGFQLNVSLISAKDGNAVSSLSANVATEAQVFDVLTREAPRLAAETFAALRPGFRLEPFREGSRRYAWIPGAVGVVSAGAGVYFLSSSFAASDKLRGSSVGGGEPMSLADARALAADGAAKQSLGAALVGVGVAALLSAGGVFVFGADHPAQIVPVASSSGGAVSLVGRLP